MTRTLIAVLALAMGLHAQTPAPSKTDPFASIRFLEGTWEARTQGASAASSSGVYTFRMELGNHILARHSSTDPGCKGPATFDCEHGDLLYVYQDSAGEPLKAIYFDNEGHVIHYNVSAASPGTVIFLSEPSPGPRFRLVYELKNSIMTGKFQALMPGASEWNSYLEWAGGKK